MKIFVVVLALIFMGSTMVEQKSRDIEQAIRLVDPIEPGAPAGEYPVIQHLDEQGYPRGYSLSFQTHVCIDHECLPVRATMHWDALGDFETLEVPSDWPLTKKEHVPFTDEEYEKLTHILKDDDSILRKYTPAALANQDPNSLWQWASVDEEKLGSTEVDAVTGATPITIQQSVVADAAYTTWTMWWWANGEIVAKLRKLTLAHIDVNYLRHFLQSDKHSYVAFALNYMLEQSLREESLVDEVFFLLEDTEREHIAPALNFLEQAVTDKKRLHQRLVQATIEMNNAHSPVVLDYLDEQDRLSPRTLEALADALDRYPYYQVHLSLKLLDKHQWYNRTTEAQIAELLASKNFFVARRAYTYLQERNVTEDTQERLKAFRQQYGERL